MYEVASVLALHPVQHMKVVPVFQIVVFRTACWFIWVFSILQMTLNITVGFQELAYPFVAIVVGGGYAFVMRQWAHDRQAIRSRLLSSASEVASAPWRRIVPWCIPTLRCS